MHEYGKDWINFIQFLVQWYNQAKVYQKETEAMFQKTNNLIQEQASLTISTLTQEIQQKNETIESLQREIQKIQQELGEIKVFTDNMLLKEKIKEENKLKKQRRSKRPARDRRNLEILEKLYAYILEKQEQKKIEP